MKELITVGATAWMAGISEHGVRDAIREGRLGCPYTFSTKRNSFTYLVDLEQVIKTWNTDEWRKRFVIPVELHAASVVVDGLEYRIFHTAPLLMRMPGADEFDMST